MFFDLKKKWKWLLIFPCVFISSIINLYSPPRRSSDFNLAVMADYRFTILDSRTTLTSLSFSIIPRSSPQNPRIQLPALSFDNPRTARRRKKKPLYLNFIPNSYQEPISAVPSSSNLDIVSSRGTIHLIFRNFPHFFFLVFLGWF